MIGKASALFVALLLAFSTIVSSAGDAEARHGRKGALATGIFLGILGAGALAAGRGNERCYRGELRCRWVRGECYRDRWGDLECESGYEKCYRPVYCD
jgi:hypothetical protein